MIPFPLLGFGGGSTPVPFGLKKVRYGGTNNQMWALTTKGDLYVAGTMAQNGLGTTEAGATISPLGWTLTNTGVTDFWPQMNYPGAIVKKGAGNYEICSSGSSPYLPSPSESTLANFWRPLDNDWQSVDGRKLLDDAVNIDGIYMVQPDGAVYQMSYLKPTLAFAEKVSFFRFGANGGSVRILLDGTLQYSGVNGMSNIGSGGSNTDLTNRVIVHPAGKRYVKATCGRGQIRDSVGTGADQLAAVIAMDEDGVWYGVGDLDYLGVNSSGVNGANPIALANVPAGSDLYLNAQYSQTWPQLSWRAGLQCYLVNKDLGLYQSTGTQGTQFGGRYSLFRDLGVTTSSKAWANMDQAIIDDGGVDYVIDGSSDQFSALVTGNGHIFWCGVGYGGTAWPSTFYAVANYKGRLDDNNLVPA